MGPSWMLGEVGTRPARRGEERVVYVRHWRRLDVLKMLEGTGDELGTTSTHYALTTMIVSHVYCTYLFQENKSYGSAVKNHLHLSSGVREVVSGTIIHFYGTKNKNAKAEAVLRKVLIYFSGL
jgi:hypothetical protein